MTCFPHLVQLHLVFCRGSEFKWVALVLLYEQLHDINVFFDVLHFGAVTDVTTKIQICQPVQTKLIFIFGRTHRAKHSKDPFSTTAVNSISQHCSHVKWRDTERKLPNE